MNSFRHWIQIAQFFPLSEIHRKYNCGEKQDNVVNKQLLSFNINQMQKPVTLLVVKER